MRNRLDNVRTLGFISPEHGPIAKASNLNKLRCLSRSKISYTTCRKSVTILTLSQDVLLKTISSDKRLYGECPSCAGSFSLAKAHLFYGEPISGPGLGAVERWRQELVAGREDLSNRKEKAKERSTRAVFSVNIGLYLEKIAPVLPGFSYDCHDCRMLSDPIDYIVFEGLTKKNRVESIQVIDIKTGGSQLKEHQRQIKDAIEKKRVEWQTYRK